MHSFDEPVGRGQLLGKTEVIHDNLNPVFSVPVITDYCFERVQKLRFLLLDIDVQNGDIEQQDFIGVVETTLGSLIESSAIGHGKTVVKTIVNPKLDLKDARLKITIEELVDNKQALQFALSASVPKKGLLARPDPFFRIFRAREDGQQVATFTSSVVKNSTGPSWSSIGASVQSLANGDRDRALVFRFYDWERSGDHIYIGEFQTSVNDLQPGPSGSKEFGLLKVDGKKREKIGTVVVSSFSVINLHTFIDYIQAGCQINLTVAIDFTASNGDPRTPKSLHYRNPNGPNPYQHALSSVATILQDYDTDKLFPAFGFGARLPTGEVSHCWAINGDSQHPECAGVEGLMQAYELALEHVQLHGPTNFSPMINSHCSRVEHEITERRNRGVQAVPWIYHILLIITDGEITDMDSTIRAVVKASSLPMSIIIVGVGTGCDFENMGILDGDDKALQDDAGRMAERDIVQFVPMRNIRAANKAEYQAELARELLAELPGQIVDYFKARRITPDKMKNTVNAL